MKGRAAFACAAAGAALVLAVALVVLLWPGRSYPGMRADCGRDELVIAGGTDVSVRSQRQALVRQWNGGRYADGRPHPHATLVEVSDSSDLQHSQLKAVEESRSCAYDVLIMDNTWTAQFADSGYLRPLKGLGDLRDFFPKALRTGRRHGVQYAVPFNMDVGLLFYREGTTPPTAWPGLLSSGPALQLSDYEGLTVNALEAVWNDGGEGQLAGEDRPALEDLRTKVYPALERLGAQVHGPLRASRQLDESTSIEAFASDDPKTRLRLMRNWPYAFSTLASEPRMRDGTRLRFGVVAPPGPSVLGGQNLAVAAHSPNPRAATDLVAFLAGKESQSRLFACGGFSPSRYSVLGLTPEHGAPGDVRVAACSAPDASGIGPAREGGALDAAQLTRLGQAVVTALERARPRPVTAHYSTFTATFRDCVEKIFDGRGTGAGAFAEAIDRSLDGRAASC